ncbi:waprin-Phi1-like [Athalia rosae]|uniref:waprin-Phi1-like n=1 Tax=Athalia rosae TaxID=37344 RepID=UPI002033A27B|nr:waprin-Phi1-like [Athalia rosae]XP_012268055.2 waprin-Phi1-like [Athalia rosae]XP_048512745.1 waprin-Phi1-like [Athalia rosae]XP_048512746.1 waprin-Phi1-like [Athalia rosae]
MASIHDTKFLVGAIVTTAVLLLTISTTSAQRNVNDYYAEKSGSCPPPLPVEICTQACYVDGHCQGNGKCCPTSCGGTICSRPVTMRKPVPVVKRGSCSAIPTGRWVCTPTCSSDGDCPGVRKCCKNRCGAMVCQKPEAEVMASMEIPGRGSDRRPALRNPYLIYMN